MIYHKKIIKTKFRAPCNQRCSLLYQQWRKKVFQRDNHRCCKCGRTNIRLNAHHIYSYAKYPHLRLQLSNGITLCSSCHYQFHKKYGKDVFPDIRTIIKQQRNKWIKKIQPMQQQIQKK